MNLRLPVPMRTFAIAAALLAVCATSACRRFPTPDALGKTASVYVRVATAEARPLTLTQPVAGTLRPADHAIVAARVMGTITRADFALGQSVAAGEVLLTLSAAELDARLVQAQSVLDEALRDYERESGLLAKNVVTIESVRALADRRRGAEAAVQEATALLDYTRVTAPFAGVITRKLVQSGDLATLGLPLFALEATTGLRAEVEVPASLPALAVGASVIVQLPGGTVTGTLAELSPAADPGSRTRLAKIALPANAGTARSGDFVRVLWPAGESSSSAITVPADAVTPFGQMERAFVVTAGQARLRLVKTAGLHDGRLVIAAGLDAGESVVLSAPASLRDGQSVTIQP